MWLRSQPLQQKRSKSSFHLQQSCSVMFNCWLCLKVPDRRSSHPTFCRHQGELERQFHPETTVWSWLWLVMPSRTVPCVAKGAQTCIVETFHTRRAYAPDIESRVSEQPTASCTSAAERRIRKSVFWGRWVAGENKLKSSQKKHAAFNDLGKFQS